MVPIARGKTILGMLSIANSTGAPIDPSVVTLLQGFTMGGGVGVGCHASHRVVGDTSQIAMPECGIGLVPDAGGSALLARAPGRLGAYLGTTGTRMGPGDAILAGFADHYLPEDHWPDLTARLTATGDARLVVSSALPPPQAALSSLSRARSLRSTPSSWPRPSRPRAFRPASSISSPASAPSSARPSPPTPTST